MQDIFPILTKKSMDLDDLPVSSALTMMESLPWVSLSSMNGWKALGFCYIIMYLYWIYHLAQGFHLMDLGMY